MPELLAGWLATYENPASRKTLSRHVAPLIAGRDLATITPGEVVAWATGGAQRIANNSVRSRIAAVRSFWAWAERHGVAVQSIEVEAERLRKAYPRLFGGAETKYPNRRLERDEVGRLLSSCRDGSWQGSRNQLIVRLGIHGLRLSDITGLTWGMREADGSWSWRGKQNRLRVLVPGPALAECLRRWERAYSAGLGRTVGGDDAVIVSVKGGKRVLWGTPLGGEAVRVTVQRLAQRAGLGHLTTHDLRRTCAHLLHEARTPDGGRQFGLVEIQRALGHASPVVTERSYLAPMARADLAISSAVLDM